MNVPPNAAAEAAKAAALDQWRPYSTRVIVAIIRVIALTMNNILELVVYSLLMLLLCPLNWICPKLYWDFEAWIFREMMRTIGYWLWTGDYTMVEYGDLPFRYQNERCLVVVNHQTTADVPTLLAAFAKKGVGAGKSTWILDVMHKKTNFGLVSFIRGDFFIESGRNVRHLQPALLSEHMRRWYWKRDRRWFIVFPEGGFLCNRREIDRAYALKNGFPVLIHSTLPRVGAVKAMLDTANPVCEYNPRPREDDPDSETCPILPRPELPTFGPALRKPPGPGFRYLVDVTMAYPKEEPLYLSTFFFGNRPPCEIAIHYRVIKIDKVPHNTEEELRDYLYELWLEKDQRLAHYHQHGHFPGCPRDEGLSIDNHLAGLFMHNGLFLALTYVIFWRAMPILWHYILMATKLCRKH